MENHKAEKQNGLNLRSLVSIAAGTVIGAGVVSLVGIGIGETGISAWLAYAAAVVLGFVLILPYIFLSSAIRVKGGNYTFIAHNLGRVMGGVYAMGFTLNVLAFSLFGASLGTYIKAIMPNANGNLFGVAVITLFLITNMLGVNIMSKSQNIMLPLLLTGLATYIVLGIFHINQPVFDFTAPQFFSNGANGFIAAVLILVFSTTGHCFTVAFSKEAANPKRDIPLAMIITTGIILVLYTMVALVTSGVLPVSEVANKPLTVTARQFMPPVLFYLFVIGGPIMALSTTLNTTFTIFSRPFHQATKDGWFPKILGTTNRAGAPYYLLILIYLIGVTPLLLNFSIAEIVNSCVLVDCVNEVLALAAILIYPQKIEGAWENRYFKVSKSFFRVGMALSLLARIFLIITTLYALTPGIGIGTLVLYVIFFLYALLRERTGKVKMEKSFELQ